MKSRVLKVGLRCVAGSALVGAVALSSGCASWFGPDETTAKTITPAPVEPVAMTDKIPPVEPRYAPPLPVETKSYVVKKGDTLSAIAARYGVCVAELVELNGLANPNKIREGKTIRLPAYAKDTGRKVAVSAKKATAASAKKAVVAKGASSDKERTCVVNGDETLASIAAQHGVTVAAIREANNLASDTLTPGMRLVIPAGKPATGSLTTLIAAEEDTAATDEEKPTLTAPPVATPVPAPSVAPLAPIGRTPIE
ncbi:MAG: LysM peptidoglycan-binding domain-containing protein [Verrucomicrobiota bacterium]|nr:LysM peptidoglycan-binding domain-containing protein [Verrucomicrobiota bacterium]